MYYSFWNLIIFGCIEGLDVRGLKGILGNLRLYLYEIVHVCESWHSILSVYVYVYLSSYLFSRWVSLLLISEKSRHVCKDFSDAIGNFFSFNISVGTFIVLPLPLCLLLGCFSVIYPPHLYYLNALQCNLQLRYHFFAVSFCFFMLCKQPGF